MKKLIYILCIVSMSACKKEQLGQNTTPSNPPNPPLKCTLTKYKNDAYTYSNDGKLLKVQNTPSSYILDYTYSGTTVTIRDTRTTPATNHTLNLNTQGYATEWDNPTAKEKVTATYDANGYVTELITKNYAGQVLTIEAFKIAYGNTVERKKMDRLPDNTYDTTTYTYTYLADKPNTAQVQYYLNEHGILRFFHKPSKNLLETEVESKLFRKYRFEYNLDANGTPISVRVYENGNQFTFGLYEFDCK